MKLLNKNEIQKQKATERVVEIQEGAKLAKKIDVLRETASKEEANLAKFRMESLKLLQEQIGLLVNTKAHLENEIIELRDEKIRLKLALEAVKDFISNKK